jgi:hypothetical protein
VIHAQDRPIHVDDKLHPAGTAPEAAQVDGRTVTDIGLLAGAIEVLVPKSR